MILQDHAPLVLNITNFVSMQTCANILLAIGASPLMAHAQEELPDIVNIANSVVLNIGTLEQSWIESMLVAQKLAIEQEKPVILDPVGAGASKLRTDTAKQILDTSVTCVRGNASEILALTDTQYHTKGVDSLYQSNVAVDAALTLANQFDCCVIISGETDFICYQNQVIKITGGDKMLTHVTGMGCAVTALLGAFCAINQNRLLSCAQAMSAMKVASEKTIKTAQGPGSFYTALLDHIYQLTETEINERCNQLATSA